LDDLFGGISSLKKLPVANDHLMYELACSGMIRLKHYLRLKSSRCPSFKMQSQLPKDIQVYNSNEANQATLDGANPMHLGNTWQHEATFPCNGEWRPLAS
jgi:hypothetical protein